MALRGAWRARARGWLGARGSGRRVLARNGTWNAATFVATAATMFFLSPFIVGRLGDAAYGIWALVLALTGYLGFADLGVRPAIVHFVARHDALGDRAAVNRHVNTAFLTFAAGGAAVLFLAGAGALWLDRFFDLPRELLGPARGALLITGLDLALALPLNAFSAVLIGKQRFDLSCRFDLAALLLRTGLIVGLLLAGHGLVAIALANAAANLFASAGKALLAFRVMPGLRFRPRLAERRAARALIGFGGFVLLYTVATQLIRETDAFVVGAGLSVAAITYFVVAAGLVRYLRSFVWAVTRMVEPASGALDARGDARAIRAMLAGTTRTMLLLTLPPLVYLLVAGGPFLARWMGERFREPSGEVLTILALGAIAPLGFRPFVSVLVGTNRIRPLALAAAVEGLCNLGLSIALVGPLGLAGVALGTAIPATVMHIFVVPRIAGRAFAIRWRELFLRAWARPLAAAAVTLLALRLVVDPAASYGWLELIGLAALTEVCFFAAYLVLVLARPAPAPAPAPEASR